VLTKDYKQENWIAAEIKMCAAQVIPFHEVSLRRSCEKVYELKK
jgi:hypothetical protein